MLVCADEGNDTKSAAKTNTNALRRTVEIGKLGRLAFPKSRIGFANLSKIERNVICLERLGRFVAMA